MKISEGTLPQDWLELAGLGSLLAFAAVIQFSIAGAEILLGVAVACWLARMATGRTSFAAPSFFRPLALYGVLTLVSSVFSVQPLTSLVDCKQLLLFLAVPVTFDLARGARARTLVTVTVSVGAASAAYGIMQYGILHYNNLGQRPLGTLGHYMTYSGLLMLTATAAAARVLFERRDRMWPALVLPALLVALITTFTRSAWVGTCVSVALLFTMKDFRLMAALPVVFALFFAVAPQQLVQRFYSMFDLHDPTSRDRVAMLHEGVRMIAADPMTGMGPNMVEKVYARFRDPEAVERLNPHLHNVPMQIAAERGLPALGVWIWFVGSTILGLARSLRTSRHRFLAAAGLGAVAAMLSAGMFEHNFGNSQFLMMYLVLITLPFAADRPDRADRTIAAAEAAA
jgi:putative inorganic carbon (HCO3(-)) transporter